MNKHLLDVDLIRWNSFLFKKAKKQRSKQIVLFFCLLFCSLTGNAQTLCDCIDELTSQATYCERIDGKARNQIITMVCINDLPRFTDGENETDGFLHCGPCTCEELEKVGEPCTIVAEFTDNGGGCMVFDEMCDCVQKTCPPGKVLNDNCDCVCPTAECPLGKVLNDDCDCVCTTAECPPGKVLNDDCECECPECPPGQVSDNNCGCVVVECPEGCPAGQVADPSDNCECKCTNRCPPDKIRNANCGCDPKPENPTGQPKCPNVGDPCNDFFSCTVDDKIDSNCECNGRFIGVPGEKCDDKDDCTVDDKFDESCNCVGVPDKDSDGDGILDCEDPCPFNIDAMVYADIKCGVWVGGNNFSGKSYFDRYGDCTPLECPATGRELIYRLKINNPSELTISFKEKVANPQLKKLNLFVLNDFCTPNSCLTEAVIHAPAKPGQNSEQVVIKNAAPGTYYIVIDGNHPEAVNDFALKVDCIGGGLATCPPNPDRYEDFENYGYGTNLLKMQPKLWKALSNSTKAPEISFAKASNGTRSLEFDRATGQKDIKFLLKKQYRGIYRISWNMYIERMQSAYFGLYGGDYWASIEHKFDMMATDYQEKWFDVELFLDLDKNTYTLFMHNRHHAKSGRYFLNIDFLNFYAPPNGHFFVDKICYAAVDAIPETKASDRLVTATLSDEQIRDKLAHREIGVFPNPADSEVFLDLRKYAGKEIDITIYNAQSTEVLRKHISKVTNERERISLDGFTNGLHIIQVKGKGMKQTAKKLLVTRMY